MSEKKPFEIARETLKQLTARKLAPTPTNYKAVYNEIGNIPSVELFPTQELRSIAQALPVKTPGQQRQRALFESAIDRMNWDAIRAALVAYGSFAQPSSSGFDTASMPAALVDSTPARPAPALTHEFLLQIARLIEYMQPALDKDDQRFVALTSELLQSIRQPDGNVAQIKQLLANYSHRLSFVAEEQAEIRSSLLGLLHMVFENIGEISSDDKWLTGQIEVLRSVTVPPLSLRRLDEVERLLKDVTLKQKDARGRTIQAQEEMRLMLAAFIDRLSHMSQSTGDFHGKLEESARLIEQARSIEEIAPVLKNVVSATKAMAVQSLAARDELHSMREQASDTERQIALLHQELDRISIQARHDPLTGALNRKGLEEALEREISTMRRKDTPLAVALLDIDNFKKLNDQLGHAHGDNALTHLATVARDCMRPQDTLARYGGEEFVVLMPDTLLQSGVAAMTRLQRELTKRFFMAGTEKLLITFSAGVAQVEEEESGMEAIRRADEAMYLAKRTGKNRVLSA